MTLQTERVQTPRFRGGRLRSRCVPSSRAARTAPWRYSAHPVPDMHVTCTSGAEKPDDPFRGARRGRQRRCRGRRGGEGRSGTQRQDREIAFKAASDIPIGHKLAIKPMRTGDTVIKYGVDIGRVVADIALGEHAHVHNIKDQALVGGDVMAMESGKRDVPGLPPGERPGGGAQPRDRPARRRSLECGLRGGWRTTSRGRWRSPPSLRPVAVRGGPRPALPHPDRHRLESQRRRGGGDRDRGRLDAAGGGRHRRDRKPVTGYGIELHGDHETILRASKTAREYVQWASELVREEAPLADLWVSTKCGESDTTSGCGGQSHRQATPSTSSTGTAPPWSSAKPRRSPAGEHLVAARCRTPEIPRTVHVHVRPLPGGGRAPQDQRPVRVPAHQGQHRGRAHHHRGEGRSATSRRVGPRECMIDGVLDKAETPDGPGLWFMDSSSAAAEMVTLCAAAGFVVHFFPPAGQHHRQSHPAERQDLCEPAHGAHHERARGRGRLGPAAQEMTPDEAGDALHRHDACAPRTGGSPPPRPSATGSSCLRGSTRAPECRHHSLRSDPWPRRRRRNRRRV